MKANCFLLLIVISACLTFSLPEHECANIIENEHSDVCTIFGERRATQPQSHLLTLSVPLPPGWLNPSRYHSVEKYSPSPVIEENIFSTTLRC